MKKQIKVNILYYAHDISFHREMLSHATQSYFDMTENETILVTACDVSDDFFDPIKDKCRRILNLKDVKKSKIDKVIKKELDSYEGMLYVVDQHIYMFGLIGNCLDTEQSKRTISMIRSMVKTFGGQFNHLIIDPQEYDMLMYLSDLIKPKDYRKLFVHIRFDSDVNQFIVYPFRNLNPRENPKMHRFCLGLTAFHGGLRMDVIDYMTNKFNLRNEDQFFYCYIKDGEKVDTRIPYQDYLEKLKHSRVTLTLPAYDESTFSVHRFIEALMNGCLSLVWHEAAYEFGFNLDPEMIDIIEEHLVLRNLSELDKRINHVDENYDTILDKLLNTDYIKQLSKTETYKFPWQN